nr:synapsin-1-like isoform X2 [Odocoileus virginianus texanus]
MILDSCDLSFQATEIRHRQKKGGQVHSYLLLGAQLSNFLLSSGGGRSGRKGAGLSHQGHQELDVRLWGRARGFGDQAGLVLEDRPPPCGKHNHGCCSCQEAQTSPECKRVPSQAPRFIFQSSPPTASSFPLQSLTSQAPRPAPAQASWQPAKLGQGSQAHLIDEKLRLGERRRHDLPQGLSLGSLLVPGCISQSRPSTLLPRILCRTSGSPLTSLLTNRPAGGKAMPHSSAEPASQRASKPAGHPPALPLPPAPGPTINPMTLASPPVPEPVSSPAPPHPRLDVRKRNKSTSNTLKTCRRG